MGSSQRHSRMRPSDMLGKNVAQTWHSTVCPLLSRPGGRRQEARSSLRRPCAPSLNSLLGRVVEGLTGLFSGC